MSCLALSDLTTLRAKEKEGHNMGASLAGLTMNIGFIILSFKLLQLTNAAQEICRYSSLVDNRFDRNNAMFAVLQSISMARPWPHILWTYLELYDDMRSFVLCLEPYSMLKTKYVMI